MLLNKLSSNCGHTKKGHQSSVKQKEPKSLESIVSYAIVGEVAMVVHQEDTFIA